VPYEPEASYFFPRYQFCTVYPFSILSSDISAASLARLDAVERALELPGKQGLAALIALRKDIPYPRSTLEPPEGLAPLTNADLPQRGVPMEERRRMLDAGERLRTTALFHDLSVAEASVLGTFLERRQYQTGEVVVRQGDPGNQLFLIESGTADVRVAAGGGPSTRVNTLGSGDFFGEIALVTGGERSADVIATSPMTVMYLSADAYARYLADSAEVGNRVSRTAMSRLHRTQRVAATVDESQAEIDDVPALFRVSAADANVLGTFMERLEVPVGTVIVRQAEAGDALYMIATGEAEVRVTNAMGQTMAVARLGPGEYFGEVALVTGGERIADVVALTSMMLLRLTREGYERFAAHTAAIQQQLAISSATRASATARTLLSGR
jgi:CRP-like cAMP-binding protein